MIIFNIMFFCLLIVNILMLIWMIKRDIHIASHNNICFKDWQDRKNTRDMGDYLIKIEYTRACTVIKNNDKVNQ